MRRRLGVQACCDHNGIANGIGCALPVESTSQAVCTNGHDIKTGVQYSTVQYSTVQCSTVQYRRGKREEGEEPVSKHQIRPGDGRWTGRRGVGRLNPRRENKIQGKNGDRERGKIEKVTEEKKIGA